MAAKQTRQVSSDVVKIGSIFVWLAMAFAMAGLPTYRLSLAARQKALHGQIIDIRKEIETIRRELKVGGETGQSAVEFFNGLCHHDQVLTAMLRKCHSREDFAVREGPRIAWAELGGSTENSRRIGVYVPAGRHWLKYAVFSNHVTVNVGPTKVVPFEKRSAFPVTAPATLAREQFVRGDARQITGAVSLEFSAAPDVFEIELQSDNDGPLRISVIGPDNVRLYDQVLPLIDGPCTFHSTVPKDSFAFPSELKPDDDGRPYFLKRKSLPVIDVALFYVRQCRPTPPPWQSIDLRLWIESEAIACLPAIYVAANYDHVASLRYRHEHPRLIEKVTDPDTEFTRLFEPYDGSGRFYFREELFAREAFASKGE